jgi:expansin
LGPLMLRVTAWDGEVLVDTLPGILDSQVLGGASQFSPLP